MLPPDLAASARPRALADALGHAACFGALGGLEDDELRATFNGGLGMVVAVEPPPSGTALAALAAAGIEAWSVGEVVEAAELGGRRYVEGKLARAAAAAR